MSLHQDISASVLEGDLGTPMTVEEVEQRLEMLSDIEVWCCDGQDHDFCCGCSC